MKFFIDSADVDAIKKFSKVGMVDGVTTNPSIIAMLLDQEPSSISFGNFILIELASRKHPQKMASSRIWSNGQHGI